MPNGDAVTTGSERSDGRASAGVGHISEWRVGDPDVAAHLIMNITAQHGCPRHGEALGAALLTAVKIDLEATGARKAVNRVPDRIEVGKGNIGPDRND